MKTLREYLEKNNYSMVTALADMLSITPGEATDFYNNISAFDTGKVIDGLQDNATDEQRAVVTALFNTYRGNEETGSISETDHKPSKNELGQMAGKAAAGGYDPARELAKGQYQHRVIQNKNKKNDRSLDKSRLKRGMYESKIIPVLVNENDELKFKIVESSLIAEMNDIAGLFESAIITSPAGGLSAIPGVGMTGLRKMAGIAPATVAAAPADEVSELESDDVNDSLSFIKNMDPDTKAVLIHIMTTPEDECQADAAQLEMVKTALCDFGCALQNWIQEANGGLDFLCPLVDNLWVKYNEI